MTIMFFSLKIMVKIQNILRMFYIHVIIRLLKSKSVLISMIDFVAILN